MKLFNSGFVLIFLSLLLTAKLQAIGDLPLLEFEEKGADWKLDFNFPASYFDISSCPNALQKNKLIGDIKKVQKNLLNLPSSCRVENISAPTSELLSENCIMNANEKITISWSLEWACKKPITSLTIGSPSLAKKNEVVLFKYILKKKSMTMEGQLGPHRSTLDFF